MSDQTHCLQLPYIAPSQSQKHVTVNEGLRMLDALVHISVASRTALAPPVEPAPGIRYIVPADAGGWNAPAHSLMAFQDGAWRAFAPHKGWTAFIEDEQALTVYQGGDAHWQTLSSGGERLARLGVNADASAQNRLTVASQAALLTHDGDDMRLVVNKAQAASTASLIFQSDYSGRAEMGLAGEDRFSVKVSSDGNQWHTALEVDPTSGAVSMPNTATAMASGGSAPVAPQGRLTLDGGILRLEPATGLAMPLASGVRNLQTDALPALEATGLAALTGYHVYLVADGAGLDLVASQTAPVTNPATGLPGLAGTSDSLHVGLAHTDEQGQFRDDVRNRLTVSRWNRRTAALQAYLPQSMQVVAGVHREVSADLRIRFVGLGDEPVMLGGGIAVDHYSNGGNVLCRLFANAIETALDEKFATSSTAFAGNVIGLIAPHEPPAGVLQTISLAARTIAGTGEIYSATGKDTQLYGQLRT